ncbi:MAG: sigma-70 family RNA polymerase sigma factor [Rhizobiaceae bacterium]|nr:sigma-70 family RNA polymerase sigma factor [Rhizobiaceae bacterium]
MNAVACSIHRDLSPAVLLSRGQASVTSTVPEEPESGAREFALLVVAVAREGDREAFARLFRHFAPRIKSFMMRSGMAAPAAEELAQETMLSVWRKAGYFDPSRAAASTWIFTIARNLKIDRLRRERQPADFGDAADPSDEPDQPASGESVMMAAQREARVRAALNSLSEEQAQIVRLSFYGEKPQSEIARELGIPLGTVKSRVRLAMTRLRMILEDEK